MARLRTIFAGPQTASMAPQLSLTVSSLDASRSIATPLSTMYMRPCRQDGVRGEREGLEETAARQSLARTRLLTIDGVSLGMRSVGLMWSAILESSVHA